MRWLKLTKDCSPNLDILEHSLASNQILYNELTSHFTMLFKNCFDKRCSSIKEKSSTKRSRLSSSLWFTQETIAENVASSNDCTKFWLNKFYSSFTIFPFIPNVLLKLSAYSGLRIIQAGMRFLSTKYRFTIHF